ncbi:MAG: hypothetical protein JW784_01920, partial [Candidatus Cloacimonetes bacterium]|nr:hypothetical protein [Candidatus Cloacimonadota bacterium]
GLTPAALGLILANLLPLYGVIFLHWQVFTILFLFWLENVIIGFYNVLKMLLARPENAPSWLAKIFLVPFFTFHYGFFTLIHGLFVILLFGGNFITSDLPTPDLVLSIIIKQKISYAFLALFLSHGLSFLLNYLGKGEYTQANLQELMTTPYSRIVVLHLVIILGGFIVMALKSPLSGLILLIVLKIYTDMRSHLKEHGKFKRRAV